MMNVLGLSSTDKPEDSGTGWETQKEDMFQGCSEQKRAFFFSEGYRR